MNRNNDPVFHPCSRLLNTVVVSCFTLSLISSCAVGPDYKKPVTDIPSVYTENAGWKVATPADDKKRGKWWESYGDAQLNTLEEQVLISNQNIKGAVASYQEAQALVSEARAGLFPSISLQAGETRAHVSSSQNPALKSSVISTPHNLSLAASWEPDIWGQLRRTAEASEANAQASEAELESATLSAQAEVALDYFQLCALDASQNLFNASVEAYTKFLHLTENQYRAGIAAQSDVLQAETQLKSTQAQAINLGVQRAQLLHAIALLTGQAASGFSLNTSGLHAALPEIPAQLPSQLLERRPDIAAAERQVAAANAQIGVQKAGYFPVFSISASGGYQSTSISDWLTAPNQIWSIGAALSETLFDAGARNARVDQAQAAYEGSVANYRQAVLTGFQEVEDNLAALRILAQEAQMQDEATEAAEHYLHVVNNQYKAGTVSYLSVSIAQTTALANERNTLNVHAQQFAAHVSLIEALGGLWVSGEVPTKK